MTSRVSVQCIHRSLVLPRLVVQATDVPSHKIHTYISNSWEPSTLHLAIQPPQPNIMPRLASARYGKDNVRVYKVDRDEATGVQTVTEMTVTCLLEGDIETS